MSYEAILKLACGESLELDGYVITKTSGLGLEHEAIRVEREGFWYHFDVCSGTGDVHGALWVAGKGDVQVLWGVDPEEPCLSGPLGSDSSLSSPRHKLVPEVQAFFDAAFELPGVSELALGQHEGEDAA